jgi:hypothetical protein
VAELVAGSAAALAVTDEAERTRWLTEELRGRRVRPRGLAWDQAGATLSPLRFRDLEAADVEGALEVLRRAGRVSV